MVDKSSSFLRSLVVQRRVLHALLMRELITRYGRKNLGVLWVFVEPMIFTLGVAAIWTAAGLHHGSSIPIVAFAVTGYSSVLLWRNCVNHSIGAIQANPVSYTHLDVYKRQGLSNAQIIVIQINHAS